VDHNLHSDRGSADFGNLRMAFEQVTNEYRLTKFDGLETHSHYRVTAYAASGLSGSLVHETHDLAPEYLHFAVHNIAVRIAGIHNDPNNFTSTFLFHGLSHE
jgi:hypothetical protein